MQADHRLCVVGGWKAAAQGTGCLPGTSLSWPAQARLQFRCRLLRNTSLRWLNSILSPTSTVFWALDRPQGSAWLVCAGPLLLSLPDFVAQAAVAQRRRRLWQGLANLCLFLPDLTVQVLLCWSLAQAAMHMNHELQTSTERADPSQPSPCFGELMALNSCDSLPDKSQSMPLLDGGP